ncbi:hypothetical protein HER32_16820 [Hymenobacter sp. BT18]|uniref:hypothetical protein n=1 Tax=Hymenobacter sp. BT18 TaxID=2835648 RepID=UPI00143E857A|nr:hypothetical protein [Hymenobacter sp. BT18]QIX62745.1 hypothetical protein HER32_16820 [Hymenobacter sp. BT18]
MFSSSKAGHLTHIVSAAVLGQVVNNGLVPPDPSTVEKYGHLIIQALVAIVTIWATVRKAMQKPETVVKMPADALPLGTAGELAKGAGHGTAQ